MSARGDSTNPGPRDARARATGWRGRRLRASLVATGRGWSVVEVGAVSVGAAWFLLLVAAVLRLRPRVGPVPDPLGRRLTPVETGLLRGGSRGRRRRGWSNCIWPARWRPGGGGPSGPVGPVCRAAVRRSPAPCTTRCSVPSTHAVCTAWTGYGTPSGTWPPNWSRRGWWCRGDGYGSYGACCSRSSPPRPRGHRGRADGGVAAVRSPRRRRGGGPVGLAPPDPARCGSPRPAAPVSRGGPPRDGTPPGRPAAERRTVRRPGAPRPAPPVHRGERAADPPAEGAHGPGRRLRRGVRELRGLTGSGGRRSGGLRLR